MPGWFFATVVVVVVVVEEPAAGNEMRPVTARHSVETRTVQRRAEGDAL
jgi:hypothetical protein